MGVGSPVEEGFTREPPQHTEVGGLGGAVVMGGGTGGESKSGSNVRRGRPLAFRKNV